MSSNILAFSPKGIRLINRNTCCYSTLMERKKKKVDKKHINKGQHPNWGSGIIAGENNPPTK